MKKAPNPKNVDPPNRRGVAFRAAAVVKWRRPDAPNAHGVWIDATPGNPGHADIVDRNQPTILPHVQGAASIACWVSAPVLV